MEFNNEMEDATQESAVDISNTNNAPVQDIPDVDYADTSSEEFFNEDKEVDNNQQQQQQQTTPQGGEENTPEVNSPYGGNNQYISALADWAKENGFEEHFDYSQFNEEDFNEDHLRQVVGTKQAMEHLNSNDPILHKIVSNGLSVNDYVQEAMHYQNMMNTDDATLFKGQMYNYLVNKNQEMGVLQIDENGNMTQESYDSIINEIESHISKMSEDQIKAKGDAIRSGINEQLNQLPDHLQRKQAAMQEQSIKKYQQDLAEYHDELSKSIDKSKSIIIPFADQSARDGFKDFFKSQTQLTEIEVNGQKQMAVPLFHRLQSDNDYLLKMMRLSHMLDNGYFTDVNNQAKADAFRQLSLSPSKRASSGNKKGTNSRNGVSYADTSSKEFFEGG